MTFDDFMKKVTENFPQATVGEDNDGQLIIYTNLIDTGVIGVIPMDNEEEE